tara:strand:+ start:473 stop:814 length:342 start_codon:yes stop_codon:yes gene_type:complete
MIRAYLIGGALIALMGGTGWLVWSFMDMRATVADQDAQIASQARSLAAYEVKAEQDQLAREVDAARAAFQRERDRAAAVAAIDLLTAELGECADAPIDPAVADILDGLRRTDD